MEHACGTLTGVVFDVFQVMQYSRSSVKTFENPSEDTFETLYNTSK